jgi:hypothetical protein
MRVLLPENGYESPAEISTGRVDLHGSHEGHNRVILGNSHQISTSSTESSNLNGVLEKLEHEQAGQEQQRYKIGIRARIGCYTWTWFTMVCQFHANINIMLTAY